MLNLFSPTTLLAANAASGLLVTVSFEGGGSPLQSRAVWGRYFGKGYPHQR
jgi:hypothetical protein